MELQSDRPVGMAVGQIPYSSIVTWADMNDVRSKDEFRKLLNHLRAMERTANEKKDDE